MNFTVRMIMCYAVLFFSISCKSKTGPTKKVCSLTFQLPFESSNYGAGYTRSDNNFILVDASGKACIPSLDTVTKAGGTIIYDKLSYDIYTYSVKTIFDETITKSIHVNSDTTISLFAGDIYGNTDAIRLDSLATTDSIRIILLDTAMVTTIVIKKNRANYLISFPGSAKKEQQQIITKDSAATIKALINMETALIGSLVRNDLFSYNAEPVTALYMKTGNEYMSCIDVDQSYFNKIHRQFIKAIFENN